MVLTKTPRGNNGFVSVYGLQVIVQDEGASVTHGRGWSEGMINGGGKQKEKRSKVKQTPNGKHSDGTRLP